MEHFGPQPHSRTLLNEFTQLAHKCYPRPFGPLPAAIYVSRTTFIESRTTNPDFVVYRQHPHGWNTSIYEASSCNDADGFLDFLLNDPLNEGGYVGDSRYAVRGQRSKEEK